MERHFHEELAELNKQLLKMAALTEEAIHNSTEALVSRDVELAKSVIAADEEIDELEVEIDEKCIDILARQQPMAGDLRFITTGMKLNAELERIADLAENISHEVIRLSNYTLLKPLVDIPKLSDNARKMVHDTIAAFVDRDEEKARQVIMADEISNNLKNEIHEELVNDYIAKDGSCATRAVPLLLIARHLERICDHAKYICEDIIFMVRAKVVKHGLEKLDEADDLSAE